MVCAMPGRSRRRGTRVRAAASPHRGGELRWRTHLRLLPPAAELTRTESGQASAGRDLRRTLPRPRLRPPLDALEDHLVDAALAREQEPDRVRSIAAWPWMTDSRLPAD